MVMVSRLWSCLCSFRCKAGKYYRPLWAMFWAMSERERWWRLIPRFVSVVRQVDLDLATINCFYASDPFKFMT